MTELEIKRYFFEPLLPWSELEKLVLQVEPATQREQALKVMIQIFDVGLQRIVWENLPTPAAESWQSRYNTASSDSSLLEMLEEQLPQFRQYFQSMVAQHCQAMAEVLHTTL